MDPMTRTDTSRLRDLRSKTDRQVAELISRKLQRAAESPVRAREVYCEVQRLLPLLGRMERRAVESRLEELAGSMALPARAACF